MAKKTYVALTPIDLDNKPYATGARLELEDDVAEPLLAVKAVEEAAAKQSTKKSDA